MIDGDSAISSESEFHAELQALLQRAHANSIDVEGGWECRNGADHPDWDVIVTEVEKKSE
jgi:hypothetical protein